MQSIIVSKNEANQRLDKLLAKYLNQAPKSFFYKMLRKKNITLNGKKADGSEKVVENDEIKLFLSDETIAKFTGEVTVQKVDANLAVLYEDENILLINKEVGMLSQKAEKDDVSLVECIVDYMLQRGQLTKEELRSFKPSICNRLDRNTSGIVVAGKTLAGLQAMAQLFKDRTIDKYYHCIVKGKVDTKQKIQGYLKKDEKTNRVSITREEQVGADPIATEYVPLRTNGSYTLLEVKLITGKTHQIRAHLQSIGHPIIGDYKYGDSATNQQMKQRYGLRNQLLHAYRVHFPKLQGACSNLSDKEFIAPRPELFENILKDL
ncbi:RluA family pseudouridine synthase [Anaerosporobacter faecicola]|uniref:RluA family pseudouridine synthase n=1 Tax=Anaerosporobacter faecicola TaxID=2718714 RepID=UPI00143B7B9C|nr:RluA family pseudouridine synthase [Anaerosporobacter faecicola]